MFMLSESPFFAQMCMLPKGNIKNYQFQRTFGGNLIKVFFLMKWQNDVCNVTEFLFGMGHGVQEFKIHVFTGDIKFGIGTND